MEEQEQQNEVQIEPTPLAPSPSHTKLIIGIVAVFVLVIAGIVGVYFVLQSMSNVEQEFGVQLADDLSDKDIAILDSFLDDREDIAQEFAEEYKQDNPDSELDTEAILIQVGDLTLISLILGAYKKQHDGKYPASLNELEPDYTPSQMFAEGKIPLDYGGVPYDYQVSEDGFGYKICHVDLENGGTDCREVSLE